MENFSKYLNIKHDQKNNYIYYISDENGLRSLYRLNLSNYEKTQVTKYSQNIKDFWIEENDVIIAVDYNGNERNQLYRLSGIQDTLDIINDPDYFHQYFTYQPKDEKFYITRNYFDSDKFEICTVDKSNHLKILNDFEQPVEIISFIEENKLLLSFEINNILHQLFTYNIETEELLKLSTPPSRFQKFIKIKQKDYAFCLSDWNNGFMNIYKLNLTDWTYNQVSGFDWDIEDVQWSEDFQHAILSVNENGCSLLYHFNIKVNKLRKLNFRSDGVIDSMQWLNDGQLLILFSSIDIPHCILRYSFDEGTSEVILENTGKANKIDWEIFSYLSFDGLKIPYFIYKTKKKDESQALIYIHGGPESQERPEFKELYYKLNQQGMSIIIPNIRGSRGYGRYYLELDDQTKRLDAMNDIISLREHMITNHNFDSQKISVMGISYGGFMTLLLITHHPSLWKSAVDIVGISDLSTFLKNTSPWRRLQRSSEYGFLGEHDQFFEKISPLLKAEGIKTPLRIFHSHYDSRVPNSESEQIVDSMKKLNKDIRFTAYENEGHIYMRRENINDMNEKIIKFLTKLC